MKKIIFLILLVLPVRASARFNPFQVVETVHFDSHDTPVTLSPGGRGRDVFSVNIQEGWHINAHKPLSPYLIPTTLDFILPEGIRVEKITYPSPEKKTLSFSSEELLLYAGSIEIPVLFSAGADISPGTYTATAVLRVQACNEKRCLPPVEKKISFYFLVNPAQQSVILPAVHPGSSGGHFENKNLWLKIIALLFAGLALNLTPCVYPLIPVTLSYFGGTSSDSKKNRPLLKSILYVFGISLTYSALGTFAGLTGSLFGSLLQQPAVLIGFALFMFFMAAGMFEWIPFRIPGFLSRKLPEGGRVLGSFGLGLTMGFAAAPCIGPFVAGLLAYVGRTRSAFTGFWMFFVLSLGLGFPYIFLAYFSNRVALLPRAGGWMKWIKSVFGFLLIGMGIYFISPLLSDRLKIGLYFILLASAGITLGFLAIPGGKKSLLRKVLGLIIILSSIIYVTRATRVIVGKEDTLHTWRPYREVSLDSVLKNGRPTIIDFSAEWCLPCRELESRVFPAPPVKEALKDWNKIRVDMTNSADSTVEKIKKRFHVLGVPTIAFFDSKGVEKPSLRVLELISPGELMEKIYAVENQEKH